MQCWHEKVRNECPKCHKDAAIPSGDKRCRCGDVIPAEWEKCQKCVRYEVMDILEERRLTRRDNWLKALDKAALIMALRQAGDPAGYRRTLSTPVDTGLEAAWKYQQESILLYRKLSKQLTHEMVDKYFDEQQALTAYIKGRITAEELIERIAD